MKHQSSSKTKVLRPEAGLVWEWKTRRRRPVDLLQEVSSSGLPRTHIERGVEGLLISRAAHNNYTNARTLFKSMPSVKMFVLSSCKRNKRSNLGTSSAMVVATMFRCLQVLCLAIVLAQINSEVECQQLATKFNQNYDNATRSNFSIIEGDSSVSPAIQEALLSGDDQASIPAIGKRSIKTWPLPFGGGNQEFTLSSAPSPSQPSAQKAHNQQQSQQQQLQQPISFAIEPPALVEYSNSTGAIIHCRPQHQQHQQQQQRQMTTITVSWRLVKSTRPQFDEQELIGTSSAGARGPQQQNGQRARWPLASSSGRRRFVRQDGALVLAPFAANQLEPELHSAQYRCCLTATGSATITSTPNTPPGSEPWRPLGLLHKQATVCSRLVRTRAVLDTQIELAVYDRFVQSNHLVVLKCQTRAQLAPHMEFTAWLRDDKILPTMDERKLAKRLRQQELTASRSSGELLAGDRSNGQEDAMAGVEEPRYLATSRGELIIRNASKQLDSGTYKCRARNKLTGQLVTSLQGGRLIIEDSFIGDSSSSSSSSAALNGAADSKSINDSAPFATVLFAQENSDTLLCAEFMSSAAAFTTTTTKSLQKFAASTAPKYHWSRWIDGQRVPITTALDYSDQRQLYTSHHHHNDHYHPHQNQLNHYRQLDSCLLISQVQAKHAGDYICDAQYMGAGVARRTLTLLVSSSKLDIQLAISKRPTPGGGYHQQFQPAGRTLSSGPGSSSALATGSNQLISLSSTSGQQAAQQQQQQQVQYVSSGVSIELNCSTASSSGDRLLWPSGANTIAWFKDAKLLFISNLNEMSVPSNGNGMDVSLATAGSNNRQQVAPSDRFMGTTKLIQPNVISIEPFGLNDQGVYQCLVFNSDENDGDGDDTYSSPGQEEFLLDLMVGGATGSGNGGLSSGLGATTSIAQTNNTSSSSTATRREQLRSSEEFRHVMQLFELQLKRNKHSLSSTVSVQLEPLLNKPQLVQKFPPSSVYQVGATMSLECIASGLPLPRIIWFLDAFVIKDDDNNDGQWDASVGGRGGGSETSSDQDSSHLLFENWFSLAEAGSAGAGAERSFPNELINDQGRFQVSHRIAPNQMSVWSQLNVTNLNQVDMGQYKCLALNQHGQIQHTGRVNILNTSSTSSSSSDTQLALKLRSYQPTNITLIAGQNATLHCPLIGQPLVRFDWFHGGERLPTGHRQQVIPSQPSSGGSSLLLENVDPAQDGGVYTCQAQLQSSSQQTSSSIASSSSLGSAGELGSALEALSAPMDTVYNLHQQQQQPLPSASSQIHVSVHVPPLIDGQSLPEVVQANEGMRTKLVCSIVQGDHPIDIKWIRRVVSGSADQNKTVKLMSGRQLVGYEVMQNMPTTDQSAESDNHQDENGDSGGGNHVTPVSQQDAITIHNLEDSCLLTFKQISHLDRGEYICLAQNRLSLSMRRVRVVVNVAPSWSIEPPSDVYALLGSRLQLDCLAHGNPQPVATWRELTSATSGTLQQQLTSGKRSTKQAQPDVQQQFVEFVANYRQRLMPNGSLVIDQVEQTDSGVLMCEQTNGIGSGLSKLINVHVQIPPYFIRPSSSTSSSSLATPSSAGPSAAKQPMPVSYGPIGTSRAAPALTQIGRIGAGVELKCSAAGNQPMLIGWRKDVSDVIDLRSDKRRLVSSELKQLPGIEQQVLESTLRLANLTRQDSGHYNCIASNEFGTEELQLRLLVQEAPEEPQLLRPIKTEPRQAILTFKRPFDGNNPIRKYSIHYRQLNVDEASGNIQSGQQQQSQDLNSASLNASSEWKQVLLDAPSQQQQQQQHEHELGLVDLDVDQLVQLSLCCLKPFTKYRVRVGAINEIGQSALSKPVDFQTEEEAIGGPPLDVSVEPTGAHSLKVRWREPSRQLQNGLIRGYYIGYRALVPLGGAGRQNPFLVGAGGQPAATTTLGASSTSSLASNTDASEQYQYKNVQLDLSATTFAPFGDQLATSGQLAGANNLSSMMMMMMGSSSTGTVPTDNHQQQQLYSTYLTNLRRKTAYSIIVQAYNKIGAGPRSDQIIVSTLDAAPPMSPQLKWISSSYNSAEFAWVSRRFSSLAAGGRSSSSLLSSHLTKRLDDLGPTQQAGGNQQQQFSERQLQPFDLMDDDDPQAYYTVNYKLDDRHFQTQRDVNGGQSMPANGEWQQLRLTKPMGVSSSVLQQQLPAAALVMNQQQQHQQQQQQQQPAHGRQAQQRLSFVLSNLRCGSAYLAYMTATNSLGQSEPGETVKFITRGGAPVAPTNSNDFLQINTTYLVLRLGAWSNAGCPISSFLIKYKLDSQSTMTIIEHQVLPTIQTTTIAGSSVFSTRPQLIGSGGGAGGDGGRQTAGLLLNSQHIQSEAAAQHHQQQLLQLQRHQQLLSDFILRNLMPSSNYKLIVEANSEAGSTTAEYDFETANFTSALLSINVNGLVASEQQPKTTDGEQEELANGGANQQQHRHHRPTDASGSGGVGGSIMNSFMLGGGSGAAGGIWQAANKQTVGVWSLTVLFVVASILMAITTLALGFKSLLRLKHHSASSSPGGGGSGARSSSLDNLVSSLFCCSASSTSSSSSSSSSAASSGSSNGCYRMASSEHQFGVANLESAKNVYCSLPLGSAATTNNNNNGSGISGQHQQQQFDSGVYHHHSQARLRLDSPDGSSGCVLGATNDLGAATISGLLRDASDRPGALEMSLARGDHQDADGSGQLPYRGQLVSSSSLSALLNDGGVNCFGPAAHSIYAPSNHLQQQSANNRHTMTLAPLSRINRLTELRLQQLNNTIRTGSHYAATLGRQQQSSDNTNCLFSPANHEHHHQHHQAKLEQSVALYGHILNNNTGGHNKLQLEGDQRAASIPNQMMAMDGRMTMDTQVDDGQANSGGQAIAASTTDTTSYLSYPANLADELASATSGYSTAPSLTGGYQRTELASSNASFKQSTQRNHHAGTIGRQQQQQAYKKQLDYVTRHQSSGEICNQAALAAATTYRPETTTHGGECMEAFLYNRQQQHDQLQTEQQYEPTPPLPQVSATTMSSIIFGGTEQNEQQKQQNQGQQQQQQLSMLSGSGQQQQQQACNGAGQLMSAPGNSIQQFMPVTSDAYGMIFGHQGELVQHQQQHHNDQEQHHQ